MKRWKDHRFNVGVLLALHIVMLFWKYEWLEYTIFCDKSLITGTEWMWVSLQITCILADRYQHFEFARSLPIPVFILWKLLVHFSVHKKHITSMHFRQDPRLPWLLARETSLEIATLIEVRPGPARQVRGRAAAGVSARGVPRVQFARTRSSDGFLS